MRSVVRMNPPELPFVLRIYLFIGPAKYLGEFTRPGGQVPFLETPSPMCKPRDTLRLIEGLFPFSQDFRCPLQFGNTLIQIHLGLPRIS